MLAGIIPAYAGSTPCPANKSSAARDHPRIRGEHVMDTEAAMRFLGSSPHTRGAPGDVSAPCFHLGIIPAYAGSTLKYLVII